MTMPDPVAVPGLLNQAKSLIPWAWLAKQLAGWAVWCNRQSAIKVVNNWTVDEATRLGLIRCKNHHHDGQMSW